MPEIWSEIRRAWSESGKCRHKVADVGLMLADVGRGRPMRAKSHQCWSHIGMTFAKCLLNSAQIAPATRHVLPRSLWPGLSTYFLDLCRCVCCVDCGKDFDNCSCEHFTNLRAPAAKFGQMLATVHQFGHASNNFGHGWQKMVRFGPRLVKFGKHLAEFGGRRMQISQTMLSGAFVEHVSSFFPLARSAVRNLASILRALFCDAGRAPQEH